MVVAEVEDEAELRMSVAIHGGDEDFVGVQGEILIIVQTVGTDFVTRVSFPQVVAPLLQKKNASR